MLYDKSYITSNKTVIFFYTVVLQLRTMIKYEGDERTYHRYKKNGDPHFYIDCTATQIDSEGRKRVCSYVGKREDRHKMQNNKGIRHTCKFIIKKSELTLHNFFQKDDKKKPDDIYCEEGVKHRLALLAGKKNLSITVCSSDEMYDFIIYCISYGVYISDKDKPIEQQAKDAYHHFKSTVLSQTMVESARIIKKQMMEIFSKADYVSVAIDEGSVFGIKNVDFNIENPLLNYKPFPAQTITITDQTAVGYSGVIYDALSNIKLYNINIGTCICDGNLAQKKAFSFDWVGSIRFKQEWLKSIIFVPCLCHRIDNAYKYHISHNAELKTIVDKVKDYPKVLNSQRQKNGAKCPSAVSTRWIYDYDILNFIRTHEKQTQAYVVLDENELNLFDILFIFKSLVTIFENPNTYFWRALYYLERGAKALDELSDNGNPYAKGFRDSLLKYTLKSEEGGLWILGYLLTRSGQKDFKERIARGSLEYDGEGLIFFEKRKSKESVDPMEQSIIDLVNDAAQQEAETQLNESHEEEEAVPEDETNEDLVNALHIAAFGTEYEEHNEVEEEEVNETEFVSSLDSAKKTLRRILLKNEIFSIISVDSMMKRFNQYLDMTDPFIDEQTDDGIGFSWSQIKLTNPAYKGIAKVALKLLNSGVSEASCERTLSSQKLIYNARRRHSNKLTLNARLTIMRAGTK